MDEQVEILKQFAAEAIKKCYTPNGDNSEFDLSEYTKIVAKKCMDLCYEVDWEYGGEDVHASWCAQAIGKHFGVKE